MKTKYTINENKMQNENKVIEAGLKNKTYSCVSCIGLKIYLYLGYNEISVFEALLHVDYILLVQAHIAQLLNFCGSVPYCMIKFPWFSSILHDQYISVVEVHIS
ncbi:hypothetical protein CHS0354_040428 [Potamilus streckersoni]|uniref:Uncharacterized protein n=1 Tax=Potamilus streckersoni TaxID=2493646 RepID=A0AAE0T0N8_9BIVA|nr:hypothetical protein CHS0354_040428 [Potamilus streckersoni]